MKITMLILTAITAITIAACNNSPAIDTINSTAIVAITTDATDKIIGTWIPIAFDFNLEGKTEPSGNWKYHDKNDEATVKKAGMEMDFGNFTFKINGTGYLGKAETTDNTFKWKKMSNGKVTIDDGEIKNTKTENIEEFYVDAKDQLIFHHSEKQFIMGKNTIQNSFELYKRK
jgi:hypothetical protein